MFPRKISHFRKMRNAAWKNFILPQNEESRPEEFHLSARCGTLPGRISSFRKMRSIAWKDFVLPQNAECRPEGFRSSAKCGTLPGRISLFRKMRNAAWKNFIFPQNAERRSEGFRLSAKCGERWMASSFRTVRNGRQAVVRGSCVNRLFMERNMPSAMKIAQKSAMGCARITPSR